MPELKKRFGFYDDPVQKALVSQLAQIRLNSIKVLYGPAVEPLHDLRVAALRASFALKFFREFLGVRNIGLLRHEFAQARRVMAKRRDWDIFFSRIQKDFQVLSVSLLQRQQVLKTIRFHRTQARQDLNDMLRSLQYKEMLKDLMQVVSKRNKRKINPQSMIKGILKKLDYQPGAFRHLELHKIRIIFKHLRYACEFLSDFYDKKKIQKGIKDIIEFQNILGEYQDAENTVRMLNRLKILKKLQVKGKLIKTEKEHAHNAYKKFEKAWTSKPLYLRSFTQFSSVIPSAIHSHSKLSYIYGKRSDCCN